MDVPGSVVLGALAVAATLPLLVWGLAGPAPDEDGAVGRNLRGDRPVVDERRRLLQQPTLTRAGRPAIRTLALRARRLTPAGMMDRLERLLRLAGSPPAWPLDRVLAAKLVVGIVGVATALFYLANEVSGQSIVLSLAVGLGGFLVPDAILWGRADERQARIRTALPDTLDQMTISVEAGLGFEAALQRIAMSTHGPLAEELSRALNEITLGVNRSQALADLVDHTDVDELRHFVYAIRQAEEFGVPIAKVLRIQASELRIRRRQRAEERAMKMPVKLVFPLFLCIFPALFIVLLGPAFIRIADLL